LAPDAWKGKFTSQTPPALLRSASHMLQNVASHTTDWDGWQGTMTRFYVSNNADI
jgi:hypothetical protein